MPMVHLCLIQLLNLSNTGETLENTHLDTTLKTFTSKSSNVLQTIHNYLATPFFDEDPFYFLNE